MTLQAYKVLYSGRVQGVGFRKRAAAIASGYPVTGYVRNLVDGRVELVAEGTSKALDGFLAHLERELHAEIRDRHKATVPVTGYKEFAIRRDTDEGV